MFMPFAFLLLLLSVPLAGGRLARLSALRVRGAGLVVGALGLQVLMASVVPDAPRPVLVALHAASYGVIAVVIWLNRAVPGLPLVALGGGTNAAVIGLNGGTLPADPAALAQAGLSVDPHRFANSGVVEDPVLPWLGDVMATPELLPFRNVISLGDLVVLLGAAVLLHSTCGTRVAALLTHRREEPAPVVAEALSPARRAAPPPPRPARRWP